MSTLTELRAAARGLAPSRSGLADWLPSRRNSLPVLRALGPVLAGSAAVLGLMWYNHAAARRAERASPPPGRFHAVAGRRVQVLDQGAGMPAAVLVHGNFVTLDDMALSGLPERVAARRRAIAVERPGFGHTPRPRGTATTPEAQAEALAALLDRLGLQRPVVVGHSYGALVAAALAVVAPEKVGGLVLVSGYHFPTPRPEALLFGALAVPGLGDALRHTLLPPLIRLATPMLLERMFAPLPVPDAVAERFPAALMARPSQLRAIAEDWAAMVPGAARLSARYGEIRCPVAILAGEGDQIVRPEAHAVPLHAAIPHSRLTLLPGIGHMLHHAAPDAVARAVEEVAAEAARAPLRAAA